MDMQNINVSLNPTKNLTGELWGVFCSHFEENIPRYNFTAISKLRASSHILEIERGRYTKLKVPSHLRLCKLCNVVEDEEHFVTECVFNTSERSHLLERIRSIYPDADLLDKRQMFVLLIGCADARIQKWFGKSLYQSFIIRNNSHGILV